MPQDARPPLPTGLQLTELDPAFRADPHAALSRLREEAPVMRDPLFGAFFLTRYEDIRGVLTDRALLQRRQQGGGSGRLRAPTAGAAAGA